MTEMQYGNQEPEKNASSEKKDLSFQELTHPYDRASYDEGKIAYDSYLNLRKLLRTDSPPCQLDENYVDPGSARPPVSKAEHRFIRAHQAIELIFDIMKLDYLAAQEALAQGDISVAIEQLKLGNSALGSSEEMFTIVGRIGAPEFLKFRDSFGTASGFQSLGYRELETILGIRDENLLDHLHPIPRGRALQVLKEKKAAEFPPEMDAWLNALSQKDSLHTTFLRYMASVDVPESFERRYQDAYEHYYAVSRPEQASKIIEAKNSWLSREETGLTANESRKAKIAILYVLHEKNENTGELRILIDELRDTEHSFQSLRATHAENVERMLGAKPGSFGTDGVTYLRSTIGQIIFRSIVEATSHSINAELIALEA